MWLVLMHKPIVLAPESPSKEVDPTVLSFDLAEKYRTICTSMTMAASAK